MIKIGVYFSKIVNALIAEAIDNTMGISMTNNLEFPCSMLDQLGRNTLLSLTRSLSIAGRVTLSLAFIMSLPICTLQTFVISVSVIFYEIEKNCRDFIGDVML